MALSIIARCNNEKCRYKFPPTGVECTGKHGKAAFRKSWLRKIFHIIGADQLKIINSIIVPSLGTCINYYDGGHSFMQERSFQAPRVHLLEVVPVDMAIFRIDETKDQGCLNYQFALKRSSSYPNCT